MLPQEGRERFARAVTSLSAAMRACEAARTSAAAAAEEIGIDPAEVALLRRAARELEIVRSSKPMQRRQLILEKVLDVSRAPGADLPKVTERKVFDFERIAGRRAEALRACAASLGDALDVLGAIDLERGALGEEATVRTAYVAFSCPELADARLAALAAGRARRDGVRVSALRTAKKSAVRLAALTVVAAPKDGESRAALVDLRAGLARAARIAATAAEARAGCAELHDAAASARSVVAVEAWEETRRHCRAAASPGWKIARRALRDAGERAAARAVGIVESGARGEDGDPLPSVEPLAAAMEKIGGAYGEWLGWPDAAAGDADAAPVSGGAATRP